MITKLDIQEKDGFLIMTDFPMNCIFNTELIENKCYPTKDADGNVKFWKKHERRAGLSPVVDNLFGLYGNFTLAKEEIKGLPIFCWSKEDYLHL